MKLSLLLFNAAILSSSAVSTPRKLCSVSPATATPTRATIMTDDSFTVDFDMNVAALVDWGDSFASKVVTGRRVTHKYTRPQNYSVTLLYGLPNIIFCPSNLLHFNVTVRTRPSVVINGIPTPQVAPYTLKFSASFSGFSGGKEFRYSTVCSGNNLFVGSWTNPPYPPEITDGRECKFDRPGNYTVTAEIHDYDDSYIAASATKVLVITSARMRHLRAHRTDDDLQASSAAFDALPEEV